jgi:hypothetical protein
MGLLPCEASVGATIPGQGAGRAAGAIASLGRLRARVDVGGGSDLGVLSEDAGDALTDASAHVLPPECAGGGARVTVSEAGEKQSGGGRGARRVHAAHGAAPRALTRGGRR